MDGFFLVSGFLIVRSWLSLPKFWPYLSKRVLRIYPGFIVAFLLSVLLFGPLGSDADYWNGVAPTNLFVSMITLGRPLVWSAFPGLPYPLLNGSLWTIRYEFFCYLGVAFLGLTGLLRRRYVVLGLFVVLTAAHVFQISPFRFRSLDARFWPLQVVRLSSFFLAGSCFSLFADVIRYTRQGVIVALALLIPSLYLPSLAQVTLPVLGGYLLFASAFVRAPRLRAFGNHADVSYGVYLYAWPIQSLIIFWFRSINPYTLMVGSFGLSYALGYASWHLVEKPFLRLKPRRPIEPAVTEPAS